MNSEPEVMNAPRIKSEKESIAKLLQNVSIKAN
jgi:hypothetical protein